MDFSQFVRYLNKNCWVKPESVLLLGVSGGADSICLLDMLQRAGIKVVVANFNHHLRLEADADSVFVRQVAESRGLEFIQGSGDVRQFARNSHKTIEEAARILRYGFLFENAVKREIATVAVAHTADDQVETILMHLLRGCGLDGMRGMLPRMKSDIDQKLFLIRPLLFAWKEEVIDYCRRNDLSYLEDSSNSEIKYFRNRLRMELIPYLQKYNLGVKKHIFNLGKIVGGDLEDIIQVSEENYRECLIKEGMDYITLSLSKIKDLSVGFKRRVIRLALKKIVPSGIEFDFDHVEKIVKSLQNINPDKHLQLPSHLEVLIEGDYLFLFKKGTQLPFDQWPMVNIGSIQEINVLGEFKISQNWMIKIEFVSTADIKFPDNSGQLSNFTYLDSDKLDKKLMIRTQLKGDRYSPLGLIGKSQKLSDLWINNKIPKRVRSSWPIILSENKIIWIPGFQPSYFHRITEETRKPIRMEIIKMND
jgi:tRNA(Ile)-lysidine synthase